MNCFAKYIFLLIGAFVILPLTIGLGQDDAETLQLTEVARIGNGSSEHDAAYEDLLLSVDEKHLAVRSGEQIEVWTLESETLVAVIDQPLGVFAWSPDGSQIATSVFETELTIWDASNGELVRTYEGIDLGSHGTRAIAWHQPDTITTGSFEYLSWNLESENSPQIINCHPGGSLLWWSPNGEYVATMGSESTLVWICDNTFERVLSIEGYTTVAWSPDSTEIAAVGIFNTLRVWSVTSGEALATSEGGENNILDISWHSSGKRIVTGHLNGELRIWDRLTPDAFWLTGHAYVSGLNDVAWAGDRLITTSTTGDIQIWEVDS